MDVAVGVVAGAVLKFIYNAAKRQLGLSGPAAAWGVMLVALVLSFIVNLASGGFAGLVFDWQNPVEALAAITAAWGTIYGTAAAWYSVVKQKEGKK